MSNHDPRQFIEDIRNHLAAHDRRLAFLFGAGTSSAVNISPAPAACEKPKHLPLIPGIELLTIECGDAVRAMGKTQEKAWDTLVKQCTEEGRFPNVENVLSKIRLKIDAIGDKETLLDLDRKKLNDIESMICSTIAKKVSPSEETIPEFIPHSDFAAWVKRVHRSAPLEIFTTNYDMLFERAFEAARVPVFDGFVGTHHPFFYPECLEEEDLLPSPKWIRVWKVHGSVNWLHLETVTGKRIVRSYVDPGGDLILPSHRKYDESRKQPYLAYIDRLSRILNVDHALLITCGYSFRDEHLNALLYGALDNRKSVNVIALQFGDLNQNDDIVKNSIRRSNLTVIGPNAGVISGMWGFWQLTQPVDDKTVSLMDIAFDSNALPEEEASPAAVSPDLGGRMRLGDFNYFCRFLNSMGPDIQ